MTMAARQPGVAWRTGARIAAACVAAGIVLLLSAALSLVRWDAKALRSVWVEADVPLVSGKPVIFVSGDNEWQAGHVAGYGLELTTFPSAESLWVMRREDFHPGSWTPDLLIDTNGEFELPGQDHHAPAPVVAPDTVLLVTSADLAAAVRERWPALAHAPVRQLLPPSEPLIAAPRLPSASQVGRLLLLSLVVGAWLSLAWRWSRDAHVPLRVLFVVLSIPVGICCHVTLTYLTGMLGLPPVPVALAVEGLVVWFLLLRLPAAGAVSTPGVAGLRRGTLLLAAVLIAAQLLASLVRRDFDGDLLTHWLPAARSYHYVGDHDIGFLTARFGVHHEATYPPAFPILMASLLWVSASDPAHSLAPGVETHVFVFLYRVVLALLSTAFVIGVGMLGLALRPAERSMALVVPLVFVLVIPPLSGRPNAGEVFLVPMVAAAILAWTSGAMLGVAELCCAGAFLAFSTLFMKNDASVILPLVVLPWAVLPNAGRIGRVPLAAAAALGLISWLLWRWNTRSLGAGAHFAFDPLTWDGLVARREIIQQLYARAVQLLLATPSWAAVLLVLPASLAWSIRGRRWRELAVPIGAGAYVALLPLLCSFARGDRMVHLEVSFERIAFSGVVSILLFGLYQVLSAQPPATDAATRADLAHVVC